MIPWSCFLLVGSHKCQCQQIKEDLRLEGDQGLHGLQCKRLTLASFIKIYEHVHTCIETLQDIIRSHAGERPLGLNFLRFRAPLMLRPAIS